jgi:transcriptional regulator with XRE-family HTH domain
VDIGRRLREVREAKGISQGEIEERSRLLRCYISRVENGPTVASIETLEKLAQALGTPIYAILYQGEESPRIEKTEKRINDWASDLRSQKYSVNFDRRLLKWKVQTVRCSFK